MKQPFNRTIQITNEKNRNEILYIYTVADILLKKEKMERTFFSYHACLFYTKNQCSSFLHETSPGNQSPLSFRDASLFDAICLQSISSALMLFLIPI